MFDWMQIAWYFAWCGLDNPFGYKGIDTKSLAVGALGLPWHETSRERLSELLTDWVSSIGCPLIVSAVTV